MATLAADGRVVERNHAARNLRPSTGAGTRPVSFPEIVLPAYREAVMTAIVAAQEGRVSRVDAVYPLRDGATGSAEFTILPWSDPTGGATALGIVRDTSIEHEIRSELVQMGKLATAGELLAGVTHELNNPLTAVLSLAELTAERPDLDPELRDDLDEIRREAQRAANIVRQLLAFVRRRDPLRLPVDINSIVRDTVALRRGALRLAGITVDLALAEVPRVTGDEHQLQQTLLNLVTNAEQAMAIAAQGTQHLYISTRPVQGGLELVVRDTGRGIPSELLERVFDPFVTTKRPGEGTGLGLSIVSRVVREHGGRVNAANHPKGGAVFTVFLPAAPPAQP
jgi:signal transduction histidine kinase